MRIFIDLGHPAHVHYFRNFIQIMKNKGHKFLITARNKEISQYLLNQYDIPFSSRGRGSNNMLGKVTYMLKADYNLLRKARGFNPDLFLSFGSIYAAHASGILRKPHLSFDDTETSTKQYKLYAPFTDYVFTPSCFQRELGQKQIRFNGYMELCYLHPNYYSPDNSVLKHLNVNKGEKYSLLRFVAWRASHDLGHSGLSTKNKRKAINNLLEYGKVFISSETKLPKDLKKYKLDIPPEKIHDVQYFANLYYGESATMASESACLGTPAIYLDDFGRGYTHEEQNKYQLVFNFDLTQNDQHESIKKGVEILRDSNDTNKWQQRRAKMLEEKIDVTAFMVWVVENYPESATKLKSNPRLQYNFQ